MTALGPALLISIFMASKVVGSKVVLCTDGCANVGLGDLSRSDQARASEFYTRLGETASSKALVPFVLFFTLLHVLLLKSPDVLRGKEEGSLSTLENTGI